MDHNSALIVFKMYLAALKPRALETPGVYGPQFTTSNVKVKISEYSSSLSPQYKQPYFPWEFSRYLPNPLPWQTIERP
jgi:hypothetical protein